MKYICIIQARTGSTRLPGKVLLKISGKTLLEHLIDRLKLSSKIDKIVVATTIDKSDDSIEELCQKIGTNCFRGSVDDVLDRYYQCLKKYPEYDSVIRITGDCPLIDSKVIDQVVSLFEQGSYDYASNVNPPTYPDGMDVEVFTKQAIERSAQEATSDFEKEHLNEYILNSDQFSKGNLKSDKDDSAYRITVDNREDFEVIEFLIRNSQPNSSYLDYVELLDNNQNIKNLNKHIKRNEGALK